MVVKKVREHSKMSTASKYPRMTLKITLLFLGLVTVFTAKLFSFCLVHQITRKVIRKYVSADGMETQEVTIEGSHQETVQIEEGDAVSRVVKRTVLHSDGDQKEVSVYQLLPYGFIAAPQCKYKSTGYTEI